MANQKNIWTDKPMNPPKEGQAGWMHEGNYDPFYTRIGHEGDLYGFLRKAFDLTKELGTKQRLLAIAIEHSHVLQISGGDGNMEMSWDSWKDDALEVFGETWAEKQMGRGEVDRMLSRKIKLARADIENER